MTQATMTECHFPPIDLSEGPTGSQDVNLSWVLTYVNGYSEPQIGHHSVYVSGGDGARGLITANFRAQDSKKE